MTFVEVPGPAILEDDPARLAVVKMAAAQNHLRVGHVAVVLAVAPTSFVITEMNWAGRFVVDERTVALDDGGITGFIPVPADAWS